MSNVEHHVDVTAAIHVPQHQHHILSMEDLLGVPAEFLYRQIDYQTTTTNSSSSNGKPLLTRSEAQVLMKIRLLAQEIDVITGLTERIAQRQNLARRLHTMIVTSGTKQPKNAPNPWITPLLPILKELTQTVEVSDGDKAGGASTSHSMALWELHHSMHALVSSLQQVTGMLWQHAEQNWALVDSLWDIMDVHDRQDAETATQSDPTRILAREKQALAELQEHLAQRLEAVLSMQYGEADGDVAPEASQSQRRLFAGSSQRSRGSGMSQSSQEGSEAEGSGMLSMEELYTPLAKVCGKLFYGHDIDKKQTSMENTFSTHTANDKKKRSSNEDGRTSQGQKSQDHRHASAEIGQASQRTATAASTMVSLFHKTTTSPTDRFRRRQRVGLDNDDDSSLDSGAAPPRGFDYTQESSSSTKHAPTKKMQRKRSRRGEEENDFTMENSQVVRASAAHALAGMVNGTL
jgi:hypothetical protein